MASACITYCTTKAHLLTTAGSHSLDHSSHLVDFASAGLVKTQDDIISYHLAKRLQSSAKHIFCSFETSVAIIAEECWRLELLQENTCYGKQLCQTGRRCWTTTILGCLAQSSCAIWIATKPAMDIWWISVGKRNTFKNGAFLGPLERTCVIMFCVFSKRHCHHLDIIWTSYVSDDVTVVQAKQCHSMEVDPENGNLSNLDCRTKFWKGLDNTFLGPPYANSRTPGGLAGLCPGTSQIQIPPPHRVLRRWRLA